MPGNTKHPGITLFYAVIVFFFQPNFSIAIRKFSGGFNFPNCSLLIYSYIHIFIYLYIHIFIYIDFAIPEDFHHSCSNF